MTAIARFIVGALLVLVPTSPVAQDVLKVTLLGTGGPEPALDRFGPATLVEAGSIRLLFDAGRGVTQRLWQTGIRLGDVNLLFLTHLHSDHTVGLPDLWLTGWMGTAFGRRRLPFEVWGPTGTADMMSALRKGYDADIRQRSEGSALPEAGIAAQAHDIQQGVLFDRNGVRVTAFDVDHGTVKMPAYGYRVDFAGRSVVISGDTRFSENLVRAAAGADVVIHEVMAGTPEALQASEPARRVMASHTSPEDAGRAFDRIKPKLAVYTHVGLIAEPSRRAALQDTILVRTRTTYAGLVELGEDMMVITVGERVDVQRPSGKR